MNYSDHTNSIIRTAKIKANEIAVIILSTQSLQYDKFKNAIACTWMRRMQEYGIKCYFYSGNHAETGIFRNTEIKVTTSDVLWHTSEKLIAALDLLIEKHPELKLVYRTNLSSYIDVDNFLTYIREKGLDVRTYTGVVGETTYIREYLYRNRYLHKLFTILPIGEKIRFASGAGFFIGVNHVQRLLSLPFRHSRLIDDVMVAKTLEIKPDETISPLRFDISGTGSHKVSAMAYENMTRAGLLFHYRFKTHDRSKDAEILKAFDDREFRYDFCTIDNL